VIVLESNETTIYDGDDPDMPMWMRFTNPGGGSSYMIGENSNKCVTMLNGVLGVGSNPHDFYVVNFIKDKGYQYSNNVLISGTYKGNISTRNVSTVGWIFGTVPNIIHRTINDVAMTVLPNAPIDADTGLPIPTIAVSTGGGVSVIKDDGTVVDITSANGWVNSGYLTFDQDNYIVAQVGNATAQGLMFRYPIPSSDITVSSGDSNLLGGGNIYNGSFSPSFGNALGGLSKIAYDENGVAVNAKNNATDILVKYWKNDNDYTKSSVAYINSDYNTGWMHGDIKLATLSDTNTTNAVGAELVTNGDFSNGTTGWAAYLSGTNFSVSNGQLVSVDDVLQSITGLTIGKYYTFNYDKIAGIGINLYNQADASTGSLGNNLPSGAFTWYATTTELGVYVNTNSTIDNVSVRLAEPDRSVNNNGLQTFGTVTKTAVATGAELVGYSGFSSSNYLEQPYNTDLDFNSGDFAYCFWSNNPATAAEYIGDRSEGNGNYRIALYLSAGDNGTMNFYTRDTAATEVAGIIGTPNQWAQIWCIRRGTSHEIWVNGINKVASVGTVRDVSYASGDAVQKIGVRYSNDNTNTGKIALFRVSATAPSAEQIAKIYNDEKHLFATNAKATLYGTSNSVTALAYDDSTELLHVGTSAGRSEFQGLNRVNNTTDAVGIAISASNGLVAED
jgi:hypothetical protein